jgi:hypothetical protein
VKVILPQTPTPKLVKFSEIPVGAIFHFATDGDFTHRLYMKVKGAVSMVWEHPDCRSGGYVPCMVSFRDGVVTSQPNPTTDFIIDSVEFHVQAPKS